MRAKPQNIDLRDIIFEDIKHRRFIAAVISEEEGLVSGIDLLKRRGEEIGVEFLFLLKEGSHISRGTVIAKFIGTPKQIAICEDNLIGLISKYSGVASAAEKVKQISNGKARVVCGAWKKLPGEIKVFSRSAVEVGGLKTRIVDENFVYLDKNYVRMFGGIEESLEAVRKMKGRLKVIQIRGETAAIEVEALEATKSGADIVMVDTGRIQDVRRVAEALRRENKRGLVKIAFASGIRLAAIPTLVGEDIDILDIGRTVLDAPLFDMRLDVLGGIDDLKEDADRGINMEVNLIGKTELWIQNIKLKNADLTEIGKAVAEVLGLKGDEVLVVDASSDHITLDILRDTLNMEQFMGKEKELLRRLSEVAGFEGTEKTSIHSEGILEMISLDKELTEEVASKAALMGRQVESAFLRRVKVFPTGGEVISGVIKDTNSPLIKQEFEKRGYQVSIGGPLPDDEIVIANSVENEIYQGYGIVITTGGVGAEEKDKTIEATKRLDPTAAVRWTVKYEKKGRHVKEGVRVGVGKVGKALIINLPGPTDEVKNCLEVVLNAISQRDYDKETLASLLASTLKTRLIRRCEHD